MADSGKKDSSVVSRSSPTLSPDGRDTKTKHRSSASIRVSRACIYCRSKHVKCDGTMPTCNRCLAENKTCFYAKSRRGIRDPKERSLISDKPPTSRLNTVELQIPVISPPIATSRPTNNKPEYNLSCGRLFSPDHDEDPLLTSYYTYFHPSHSLFLPKHHFLKYLELNPEPMTFLLEAMRFVGSLYVAHPRTEELRDTAFSAACGPLPMTPQSVLGLLILSVAAVGEMKLDYQNGWTDRAISIALQIGMQHKAFADTTSDPVVAECYRRAYWGLYILDCMRIGRNPTDKISLDERHGDVDLPCEEWEYDAGQIPQPTSLEQYDLQYSVGLAEFSSWAYLVDLCRISRKLVPSHNDTLSDKDAEIFERADGLLCDWLIKLPQWKMDLVDSAGIADMVLFHAIAFAHQNRLRIRQSASRQGLNLRHTFPLGPTRGPYQQAQNVKAFGWNAIPIDVQAANGVCSLFRQSFPTKNISPVFMSGMLRVALAYLDACVFLGLDTPTYREKLNLLLHVVTAHGKLWPISRKIAEEVREVAQDYCLIPQLPKQNPLIDSWVPAVNPAATLGDITMPADLGLSVYADCSGPGKWNESSNEDSA